MTSWLIYKPLLFQVEGGFQKLPNDGGNYNSLGELIGTNFGISARFYEDILGRPTTLNDILSLTKAKATQLYKTHFWDGMRASEINNQKLANTYVDHGINAGPSRSIKMMQYLLKHSYNINLEIDGGIGPITLGAINSVEPTDLTNAFNQFRAMYYRYLGNDLEGINQNLRNFFKYELKVSPRISQSGLVQSWLNRLEEFAVNNTGKGLSALTGLGFFLSCI